MLRNTIVNAGLNPYPFDGTAESQNIAIHIAGFGTEDITTNTIRDNQVYTDVVASGGQVVIYRDPAGSGDDLRYSMDDFNAMDGTGGDVISGNTHLEDDPCSGVCR